MANNGSKKARKVKNLGTIYYDNSKNQWIGQIEIGKYENGRSKYKRFLGDSQNSVIDKMREYRENHPNNIILNKQDDISLITVEDFFWNFLKTVKKNKLKPSSFTRESGILKNNIIPYIGKYSLSQLNSSIIQTELINVLVSKPYSFSTVHKVYVLLKEGLGYALRQGLIIKNPCDLVEEPSRKIFTNTKEIRFFDDDEIERFEKCALAIDKKTNLYHYRNGLALVSVIYTGLRVGELMALKWKDIDLEQGFLRVHSNSVAMYDDNNKRHIIIQDSTKTKKSRIVHMTKSAKKYYKLMKDTYKPNNEDYVFHVLNGRDSNRAMNTYTWICKKAGIDNPQGVHTLRHTCASLLIRNGVDIKIVSEMLGHSDVAFTYNTYVHILEEQKAKIIGELDI